jgi:chemosensory pili system protein ChpA (sensor histidine kinase/response regulator)
MKTRMVPASSIVSRLQRSVRQTARLVDKRVELHVAGAQTAVDGQVLNGLVDPLMHLLRNAVDHGIEDVALRAERSKPPVGRIDLSFAREGASMVVRVSDDGAGLDLARIRAKAEGLGHLARAQVASDDELARLILLPGFSTREDATQVSGRGIGMDAVFTKVQALKGTLRLVAAPGRGLTVELRLPTSLMTTHGLLIRHGDQVLAISSYGINDIRYVAREQVQALGHGYVYQEERHAYELNRLDALIGGSMHGDDRGWFPALLVHTDSGALRAIRVQDVLDSQEIVVKGLGRYVARPHGVVGVTILGDGSIAPVLDLPQLLRAPQRAARSAAAATTGTTAARSPVEGRGSALVVDDSLSARRAAAQFMRDAGFTVRTAIDGIEAATLIEKQVPDIVLVDMEMPRMNGLELTTHVRTRDSTRHVPIIMITSRSTEKHRRQAESAGVNVYLTKPFSDDELLEHVERLTAGKPVQS